jgi:hypothetical protein
MKTITTLTFVISAMAAFGQQPVNPFALTNVADGNRVSLDSISTPVVVIFTSNECAFDNYYPTRIKLLIGLYTGKIQFLLINAHVEPGESSVNMAMKYKTWGLDAPYLADKDQLAMDILGARKSPEAFLLQKTGGHYVIVYKGLIDDNPQVPSDVKQNYLKDSIDKLLAGQKITIPEMRAIGCSIRRR